MSRQHTNSDQTRIERKGRTHPDVASAAHAALAAHSAHDTPGSPRDTSSLSGQRIGSYQVMRKIGQGGMGMVFEAYEPNLERTVAIKVLPPQLATDEEWVARFMREARTAARLDHTGIAAIYAADRTEDGVCYIAMQYVQGCDLGDWLHREPLPIPVALKVAREIALALGAAHAAGIVHRDIKPDNVRIEPTGRVKVMDFGLAKGGSFAPRITDAGTFLGTPEYSSPEQCESLQIDHRSDLYSLGVVLYEMVSGTVPHRAETPYKLFRKIIEDAPLPLRELDARIPRNVARVIERLLEKHPADRYRSADELVSDLDTLFHHEQVDLAAYFAEVSTTESDSQAATVALASTGVSDQATTRIKPASRQRKRRTFADNALRQGPSQVASLVLLTAVLLIGAMAIVSLPRTTILPVLEARTPASDLARPLPRVVPHRLAILGFTPKGPTNQDFAWLGSCLPEMLSVNLSALEHIEVLSIQDAASALEQANGNDLLAAKYLGAGLTVHGTFFPQGDQVVFYAVLQALEHGRLVVKTGITCTGQVDRFVDAISDLGRQLAALLEARSTDAQVQALPELNDQLQRQSNSQLVFVSRNPQKHPPTRRDRELEHAAQSAGDAPLTGDKQFVGHAQSAEDEQQGNRQDNLQLPADPADRGRIEGLRKQADESSVEKQPSSTPPSGPTPTHPGSLAGGGTLQGKAWDQRGQADQHASDDDLKHLEETMPRYASFLRQLRRLASGSQWAYESGPRGAAPARGITARSKEPAEGLGMHQPGAPREDPAHEDPERTPANDGWDKLNRDQQNELLAIQEAQLDASQRQSMAIKHFYIGRDAFARGERNRAIQHLRKALSYDPRFQACELQLQQVLSEPEEAK